MAARIYQNTRWTEEDDNLLRSMSQSGKSLTLMTAKLKRPMLSIKSRAEGSGDQHPWHRYRPAAPAQIGGLGNLEPAETPFGCVHPG